MKKAVIDGVNYIKEDDLIELMVEHVTEYEDLKALYTCKNDELRTYDELFSFYMKDDEIYNKFKREYLKKRYNALMRIGT